MMRKAIIEFDWVIRAKVLKPKKQKKTWNDQFEIIAPSPWKAQKNVQYECERKGWEFVRVLNTRKKGVAFAFWEDTNDFLTDQELAEALKTDWADYVARFIMRSRVFHSELMKTVSATEMSTPADAFIGLGGGVTIDHHSASLLSWSPVRKVSVTLRTDNPSNYEEVDIPPYHLLSACRKVWQE